MLSREQILAMEPSRKNNVLMHMVVLGNKAWVNERGTKDNLYTFVNFAKEMPKNKGLEFNEIDREEIDYHKMIVSDIPDYFGDISAAWEVVEKMKLIVAPNNNGGWKAGRMDGARLEQHHVIWSKRWVFASTAPEAICKAALLAVLGL